MAKFRKNPVEVEAFQISMYTMFKREYPQWFSESAAQGIVNISENPSYPVACTIKTLEGDMDACIGDYIVKGAKGELYPCRPDIFELLYKEC